MLDQLYWGRKVSRAGKKQFTHTSLTVHPSSTYQNQKAKKAGLYLSVSEILSIEAKPGLEIWKLNEHIKMAAKTPRLPDPETDANYIRRVKSKHMESNI